MSAHHRTARWYALRRKMKPRIEAMLPMACVNRCGRQVQRGEKWDLSHIVSVAKGKAMGWPSERIDHYTNIGPAHVSCNRSAGGTEGAEIKNRRARAARKVPDWRSW